MKKSEFIRIIRVIRVQIGVLNAAMQRLATYATSKLKFFVPIFKHKNHNNHNKSVAHQIV